MVGIVLISHSSGLAEGAAELVRQIAAGVRVVPAGGTDDGRLGTSIDRISAAIAEADGGDGVLLIPDLGSSVLSARTLLDDFDEDGTGPRVRLADAPFIEGAVAAAVAASAGLDLDAVSESAEEARDVRKF
jgi:dihydroxyacetone kinase phosphotransfer subunit